LPAPAATKQAVDAAVGYPANRRCRRPGVMRKTGRAAADSGVPRA